MMLIPQRPLVLLGSAPPRAAGSSSGPVAPTPPARAAARPCSFFATISRRMWRSRLRSATRRLSYEFSSRNCRSSRNSLKPSPAYSGRRRIKRLLANPMLAADLHHRLACFLFPQHPQDLLFAVNPSCLYPGSPASYRGGTTVCSKRSALRVRKAAALLRKLGYLQPRCAPVALAVPRRPPLEW